MVRPRNPADGPAADRSPVRDATDRRNRPRCGGAGAGVGSRRCAADHPIFGRDVPDAAWRPTPELLARLAAGAASSARPASPTSRRSRPAPSPIRPGSGAPPSDDLGVAWQRRPDRDRSTSRAAPEWARWWSGGAFNHAIAAVEPRAAARPGRRGDRLGGRGRRGPPPDERASCATRSTRPPGCSRGQGVGAGDRVGIFLPMLAETVDRGRWRSAGSRRSSRRSSRATARRRSRPGCDDCEATRPDHRRRLPPPRQPSCR